MLEIMETSTHACGFKRLTVAHCQLYCIIEPSLFQIGYHAPTSGMSLCKVCRAGYISTISASAPTGFSQVGVEYMWCEDGADDV